MVGRSARGGEWSLRGYFCDISWDGASLRVHGRNRAARAIFNETDPSSDLVVAVADIQEVAFQPASFTSNGVLTIQTRGGGRHSIYALRQHNANFSRLAELLRSAAPVAPVAPAGPGSAEHSTGVGSHDAARPADSVDPIELLERLAKLRDAGVLTAAEFETKKAQLLRRI